MGDFNGILETDHLIVCSGLLYRKFSQSSSLHVQINLSHVQNPWTHVHIAIIISGIGSISASIVCENWAPGLEARRLYSACLAFEFEIVAEELMLRLACFPCKGCCGCGHQLGQYWHLLTVTPAQPAIKNDGRSLYLTSWEVLPCSLLNWTGCSASHQSESISSYSKGLNIVSQEKAGLHVCFGKVPHSASRMQCKPIAALRLIS